MADDGFRPTRIALRSAMTIGSVGFDRVAHILTTITTKAEIPNRVKLKV